ncbi:MAG TPA: hypothetical protein VJO36_10130 [Actinomycetota bacterium]|nr:hypothetical protein [Actinomycetota bacterium]
MSDRARRSDEILGANVLLTGWSKGREDEVAETLDLLTKDPIDLAGIKLPYVALAKVSLDKADAARRALEGSGASVEIEDAWVTRDGPPPGASRPPCPFCGSTKTQPYTHAGPAAKPSMKCTTCGQRFRV